MLHRSEPLTPKSELNPLFMPLWLLCMHKVGLGAAGPYTCTSMYRPEKQFMSRLSYKP